MYVTPPPASHHAARGGQDLEAGRVVGPAVDRPQCGPDVVRPGYG